MRLKRRREMRPGGNGQLLALALGVGAALAGAASAAVSDELIPTVSHANLSAVLLSLCLLTAAGRNRS